jgi:hypothetical protein
VLVRLQLADDVECSMSAIRSSTIGSRRKPMGRPAVRGTAHDGLG